MGYRNGNDKVIIDRQILLQLRSYISVCPILQLSHNDVPGVGLGGCWNQVVPSHSQGSQQAKPENRKTKIFACLGFSCLDLSWLLLSLLVLSSLVLACLGFSLLLF